MTRQSTIGFHSPKARSSTLYAQHLINTQVHILYALSLYLKKPLKKQRELWFSINVEAQGVYVGKWWWRGIKRGLVGWRIRWVFFSLAYAGTVWIYIYIYIYEFTQFLISSTWGFVNFRFYKTILVLGFDFAENLCFCRVFCRWSSLYDPGTSICSLFFIYLSIVFLIINCWINVFICNVVCRI